MKYVVTGGAGFIGSHLTRFLVNSGHTVSVIDNLHRGKLLNLSDVSNKITFHKIDILDFDALEKITKDTDGIFHQAALTSVTESFEQTDNYYQVNVGGTENVFKIAQKHGIKVVYASSSSVYGNPQKIPITENSERRPINPYGMTKLEDEKLAEKYSSSGSSIIGMRYFNVYGPGQTPDYAGVITKFYDNISKNIPPVIFGDGSQIRDFISVIDVSKANFMAMQSKLNFGFLNVGTGVPTSIRSLADIMIKLSGKMLEPAYAKLPEGDVKASQADTRLAKELISWTADTKLDDGLEKFFFK